MMKKATLTLIGVVLSLLMHAGVQADSPAIPDPVFPVEEIELSEKEESEDKEPVYKAPEDIALAELPNEKYVEEMAGKVLVFDLVASFCGTCIGGLSEIKKLSEKYKGKIYIAGMTKETKKELIPKKDQKKLTDAQWRWQRFLKLSSPGFLEFLYNPESLAFFSRYFKESYPALVILGKDGRLLLDTATNGFPTKRTADGGKTKDYGKIAAIIKKEIERKNNLSMKTCPLVAALLLVPALSFAEGLPCPRVEGNRIVTGKGKDKKTLVLRGVAISDPFVFDYKKYDMPVAYVPAKAKKLFGANALRLAIHPLSFVRYKDPSSIEIDPKKLSRIWKFIDLIRAAAEEQELYTIIDLHAIGNPIIGALSPGKLWRAPRDIAQEFWSAAAERYKDRCDVVFELFNEPFGSPIFGSVTTLTHLDLRGYYQERIADLIAAGSTNNLVILSGLEYSNNLAAFGKDPLVFVSVENFDAPLNDPPRVIDVRSRVAYGIHFYPSRPNAGGPRSGRKVIGDAMKKAIPDNLPVVVTEFGFNPGKNQAQILGNLKRLGAMKPKEFIHRVAVDPAHWNPDALERFLKDFQFDKPGQAEKFCRNLYNGELMADMAACLTQSGQSAVMGGGAREIIREEPVLSPQMPQDGELLHILREMPFLLELADKPGFREAFCDAIGSETGCFAWLFTDWGDALVQPGRYGPDMKEKDLSPFGAWYRKKLTKP